MKHPANFCQLLFISIIAIFGYIDAVVYNWRADCRGHLIQGHLQGNAPRGIYSELPISDICAADLSQPIGNKYILCSNCLEKCDNSQIARLSSRLMFISNEKPPTPRLTWFQVDTPLSTLGDMEHQCHMYESTASLIASGHATDRVSPTADETSTDALRSFSKTSVLFVSISFIILMVISLAWLVFYYIQRFRYAHAKDRLQRRLFNAARKALARIPTRSVRSGDDDLQTDCAICLDPYQLNDIVRILPCRHIYHKSCIDPWLLEHRTCPMCKADILKYFGYQYYDAHLGRSEDGRIEIGGGVTTPPNLDDSNRRHIDEVITTSRSSDGGSAHGNVSDDEEFGYSARDNSREESRRRKLLFKQFVHQILNTSEGDDLREPQHPSSSSSAPIAATVAGTSHSAQGSSSSSSSGSSNKPSSSQIVNLVQVKSRSATIRKDPSTSHSHYHQPTPVDVTSDRRASTSSQLV